MGSKRNSGNNDKRGDRGSPKYYGRPTYNIYLGSQDDRRGTYYDKGYQKSDRGNRGKLNDDRNWQSKVRGYYRRNWKDKYDSPFSQGIRKGACSIIFILVLMVAGLWVIREATQFRVPYTHHIPQTAVTRTLFSSVYGVDVFVSHYNDTIIECDSVPRLVEEDNYPVPLSVGWNSSQLLTKTGEKTLQFAYGYSAPLVNGWHAKHLGLEGKLGTRSTVYKEFINRVDRSGFVLTGNTSWYLDDYSFGKEEHTLYGSYYGGTNTLVKKQFGLFAYENGCPEGHYMSVLQGVTYEFFSNDSYQKSDGKVYHLTTPYPNSVLCVRTCSYNEHELYKQKGYKPSQVYMSGLNDKLDGFPTGSNYLAFCDDEGFFGFSDLAEEGYLFTNSTGGLQVVYNKESFIRLNDGIPVFDYCVLGSYDKVKYVEIPSFVPRLYITACYDTYNLTKNADNEYYLRAVRPQVGSSYAPIPDQNFVKDNGYSYSDDDLKKFHLVPDCFRVRGGSITNGYGYFLGDVNGVGITEYGGGYLTQVNSGYQTSYPGDYFFCKDTNNHVGTFYTRTVDNSYYVYDEVPYNVTMVLIQGTTVKCQKKGQACERGLSLFITDEGVEEREARLIGDSLYVEAPDPMSTYVYDANVTPTENERNEYLMDAAAIAGKEPLKTDTQNISVTLRYDGVAVVYNNGYHWVYDTESDISDFAETGVIPVVIMEPVSRVSLLNVSETALNLFKCEYPAGYYNLDMLKDNNGTIENCTQYGVFEVPLINRKVGRVVGYVVYATIFGACLLKNIRKPFQEALPYEGNFIKRWLNKEDDSDASWEGPPGQKM